MLFPCLETRLSLAMVQHQDSIWGSLCSPPTQACQAHGALIDTFLITHKEASENTCLSLLYMASPLEPSGFHTPGRNKHQTGGGEKGEERTQLLPQDHPCKSPSHWPSTLSSEASKLNLTVSPSSSRKLLDSPVVFIYFLANLNSTPELRDEPTPTQAVRNRTENSVNTDPPKQLGQEPDCQDSLWALKPRNSPPTVTNPESYQASVTYQLLQFPYVQNGVNNTMYFLELL